MHDGPRALALWDAVNPTNPKNPHSGAEPFGTTTYYTGPASPRFGDSEHSWTTGSAAWKYFVPLEGILGIQPTFHGLKIDPAVPPEWKQYSVRRRYRGAVYDITVRNPDGVGSGVKSIRVDGKPIEGTVLPIAKRGTVKVDVVMGSSGGTDAR
jgi:cellobiose phosphorylase